LPNTKHLLKGIKMTRTPIDVQKLTQRKVTVPLIMIVALVIFGFRFNNITVGYFSDFFMLKAVAEEQFKTIAKSVKSNAALITGHIRTYELNENAKAMGRVEDEIFNLELYIADNGQNDITRDRLRDLKGDKNRLTRVRACIVRNAPDEECGDII